LHDLQQAFNVTKSLYEFLLASISTNAVHMIRYDRMYANLETSPLKINQGH